MRFSVPLIAAGMFLGVVAPDGAAANAATVRVVLSGSVEPVGEVAVDSSSLFRLVRSGKVTIDLLATHVFIERRGHAASHAVNLRELSADRDFTLRDGDKLVFARAHQQ